MKSRVAVSVLFTLVAASFVPNAAVAVAKLRLRAGKVFDCLAVHTPIRVPPGQKSHASAGVQPSSAERVSMDLDSLHTQNLPSSDDKDLEFLATATRIREILDRIDNK
jgi:hypothetical protein